MEKVVASWLRRLYIASRAHFDAAIWYERIHLKLGILAIILSTIVGTSVFAMIQKQSDIYVQIAVGLLSISAAVSSAIQTFTRLENRAAKHRNAGMRFGSLIRELENVLASTIQNQKEFDTLISGFREKYDLVGEEAPSIPQHIWNEAIMPSAYCATSGQDEYIEVINKMCKNKTANKAN